MWPHSSVPAIFLTQNLRKCLTNVTQDKRDGMTQLLWWSVHHLYRLRNGGLHMIMCLRQSMIIPSLVMVISQLPDMFTILIESK